MHPSRLRGAGALIVLCAMASAMRGQSSFITGISFPANESGRFGSVTAPPYPLDVSSSGTNPGFIINPNPPAVVGGFALHSHDYLSANIPNPAINVVTFTFDSPVVVDQLQVIQHANGVTRIEGFVGNSLGSLVSMGNIFGPAGDLLGESAFIDGTTNPTPYVFDFNNAISGTIYQFVVTKTSSAGGWATYRMFPADALGVQFGPALTAIPRALDLCSARRTERAWVGDVAAARAGEENLK